MRPARRELAAAALLLSLALGALCASAQSLPSARRAMLIRGPDRAKGLPFFQPNAIAALAGSYSLDGSSATPAASAASVWFTREYLVLGPSWKRSDMAGLAAYVQALPASQAVALKLSDYYLLFELPGSLPASLRSAFIEAFERKFLVFYQNAGSEAEISFPAFVDY
jgi:hypothetical protein